LVVFRRAPFLLGRKKVRLSAGRFGWQCRIQTDFRPVAQEFNQLINIMDIASVTTLDMFFILPFKDRLLPFQWLSLVFNINDENPVVIAVN
jgi:hypothetical protein